MAAGRHDLRQIPAHLLLVVDVGRRQRGKADDGVHRGADIMRHVVQKGRLGAVGVLGSFQRNAQVGTAVLQFSIQPLDLFHVQVHVGTVDARNFHVAVVHTQQQARDHEKE